MFLNVPFDERYGPLLIALLAGLTALGRDPHCVLEVPSGGRNRLDRIYDLIASCRASIHDLSRISVSGPMRVPRFNMPFELGLAFAIAKRQNHNFFVLEAKTHRLQATLSDLNGHDPYIHGETQDGVLRCILGCFGTPSQPTLPTLRSLTRKLGRAVFKLEREHGVRHPFHPYFFRQVVNAAVQLARAEGVIG
ncbi:MAG: hypothetical protein WAM82_16685 [Thermoanaerobaculia bacterium]